jgi:hypothetical protein
MAGPITDPSERRAALKLLKALLAAPCDEVVLFQRRQLRKRLKPFTEAEKDFLASSSCTPNEGRTRNPTGDAPA